LHQIDNAAVAVAVAEELRLQGFHITIDHIHEGLANVSWPGVLKCSPTKHMARTDYFLIAPQRDSAAKLASTLEEMYPGQRPALIFGSSDDKDIAACWPNSCPHVSSVYLAQADHPRASAPAALRRP